MDAASTDRAYARALRDKASITGVRAGVAYSADDVGCRIVGYTPQELGGTVVQGDQKLTMLKSDLDAQNYPAPVKGDKVAVQARVTTVQHVDLNTIKIGETIIAYIVQCRG